MRTIIAVAVGLVAVANCVSAQDNKTYSASEATKHVGETATVTDKVTTVFESKAGNVFLNFGAGYPNQLFTAFIPKDSAEQFPNAKELDGQTVSIRGKIVLYKGKPEIVLDHPSQLTSRTKVVGQSQFDPDAYSATKTTPPADPSRPMSFNAPDAVEQQDLLRKHQAMTGEQPDASNPLSQPRLGTAQSDPDVTKEYSASEAAKHVSETATVTDKVANVFESKAGNIFLNFGARYPNQVFAAFIPKDSADQFPNVKELDGRTVSITGKIVLYKGKPEIVLDHPSMIKSK